MCSATTTPPKMERSERTVALLFMVGGALMVVGAGLFSFLIAQDVACWLFLAGAIMFGGVQIWQDAPADTVTVRRLKRIMNLADLLFIAAGLLMVDTRYMFMRGLFGSQIDYIFTLYNKWVLLLLIAAVLEIYTMHRIGSETKKNG